SLAAVCSAARQRVDQRRRYSWRLGYPAGVRAAVARGVVQRDRGDRARPLGALDPAVDARRPGTGPDRARIDPGGADFAPPERADRLAADRRPGGRLDPAVRDRLYRLPAPGSARLSNRLPRPTSIGSAPEHSGADRIFCRLRGWAISP